MVVSVEPLLSPADYFLWKHNLLDVEHRRYLFLKSRHFGVSLWRPKPTDWPLHVHVCRILDLAALELDSIPVRMLSGNSWAVLSKTPPLRTMSDEEYMALEANAMSWLR